MPCSANNSKSNNHSRAYLHNPHGNSGGARLPHEDSRDVRVCKFCNGTHGSLKCAQYVGKQVRQHRAVSLGLYSLCLSTKHSREQCLGYNNNLLFTCSLCEQKSHISPVCELVCKST